MHSGMLWFDNSKTTLKSKIEKAIDYYFKKYGRKPDLCLIHPSMAYPGDMPEIEGMTIRLYRPVLQGYIWIGIEDKN